MENLRQSVKAVKYLWIIWQTVRKDIPAEQKVKILEMMREDLKRAASQDTKVFIKERIVDALVDKVLSLFSAGKDIFSIVLNMVCKLFEFVDDLIVAIRSLVFLMQYTAIFYVSKEIDTLWYIIETDIPEEMWLLIKKNDVEEDLV